MLRGDLPHQVAHGLDVEGLVQAPVGQALQELQRIAGEGGPAEEHEARGQPRVLRGDRLVHRLRPHWHHDVAEDHVEVGVLLQANDGLGPVGAVRQPVAVAQAAAQQPPQQRLVIDDQDAREDPLAARYGGIGWTCPIFHFAKKPNT